MPTPAETFPALVHDIYPGIAPEKYAGTNTGRVVLIIGASKGIGVASANAFAASGASLFLTARSSGLLEKVKESIVSKYKVPVEVATMDATDEESVKSGVAKVIATYGKIDVVVSNAGGGSNVGPMASASTSAKGWMDDVNINLGTSVIIAFTGIASESATLPELRKTKGYIILLSSLFGIMRLPDLSSYNMGKMTLIRLAEWIHIENSAAGVKAFAFHPGLIATELTGPIIEADPKQKEVFCDPAELIRLVAGQEDWLSGRYVDCTWDLDALTKKKDAILEDDALKLRVALPYSA